MWHGRTQQIERPPIAHINALAASYREREKDRPGKDLINLGQAILGLPPPEGALQAVRDYLAIGGPHGYSPDPGLPEVLRPVSQFLRERKGIAAASPDKLILTCGANQAFVNALWTLTQPGDEVVFFGPNYFDHVYAIKLAACVPKEVGLMKVGQRFELPFTALKRALTSKTRCLVLVSPANPAGMVLPEPQLEQLCELCRQRDIWLISDETYDLFTFGSVRHVSPAACGVHDQVVVLGSFSKTFGLAAWRIGYLYGPERFIEQAIKVQDAVVVCAPVASQHAIRAALEQTESYCRTALQTLVRRREALLDVLQPLSALVPIVPDGATFCMAEISSREPSFELACALVQQAGLVTVPGAAFGQYGEGHLRLSFGNQPVERIAEAGDRLREFFASRV